VTRTLDPTVVSALGGEVVRIALLAELEFASGTLYMTDLPYNVNYGGNTYVGGGNLVSVNPVKESDGLEAHGLQFTLSGVPSSAISMVLQEHIQGKPARLKVMLFSENGTPIGTPVEEWTGRLDQMSIEDGPQSATVTVTAESRLADFKRSYVRRYTNEDQQAEYPGDKFFEHLQAIQDLEIIWPARQWYIKNT
jgi:hypothetical protein